jgi:hypothetical protein
VKSRYYAYTNPKAERKLQSKAKWTKNASNKIPSVTIPKHGARADKDVEREGDKK